MGISLTGATCLFGGVDGDNSQPAIYVVGGSTNSSSIQYTGLQRYSIAEKTWKTITPLVTVTENRQHHGAAYMLDTSTILVYGGSQQNGDTQPSTQTFLIDTFPPYEVNSYQSGTTPPVVDPILLPWDNGHVGMIGGSTTNVEVYRFGVDEGWENVGVELSSALPSHLIAQCALLTLDDQSKVLETFDLSQSPNTVTRTVLLDAGGIVANNGETVGGSSASISASSSSSSALSRSRKRKRDIPSLSQFPSYNSTNAPTTTRSGYSLAQGSNGLIVFSGGSSSSPIEIFNQSGNGWINAAQFLNPQGKSQTVIGGPTSTGTTTTPTSSHTAGAGASHSGKNHTATILGAVLGALCGFGALLILGLLLLRYLKRSKHLEQQQQRQSYSSDKKTWGAYGHGRSSTEDHNRLRPLANAGQPMGRSPVPSAVPSQVESMAMFGKSEYKKGHTRNTSSMSNKLKLDPIDSSRISFGPGMFSRTREKSPLKISRPIMQEPAPEVMARPTVEVAQASSGTIAPVANIQSNSNRKTDEGWSTYFQGNDVMNLATARPSFASEHARPGSSSSSKRGSKRGSYWPDPNPQPVAMKTTPINPSGLNNMRDSSGNMLSAISVPMGSPRLGHSDSYQKEAGLVVPDAQQGRISSASSATSENDDYEAVNYDKIGDAYSSGIPASVHELPAWSPVGNTWSGPVQRQLRSRGSSVSDYTSSMAIPPPATSSSKDSSIPSFPMPNTIRHINNEPTSGVTALPIVEHPAPAHFAVTTRQGPPPSRPARTPLELQSQTQPQQPARDYFGPSAPRIHQNANTDVSWLNLRADSISEKPPPEDSNR